MNKDKARDPLTQRILDLTLEMIFLLTGEGHMVVRIHETINDKSHHQIEGYSRSQSFNTEPPTHSGIHEQNHEKILELTNQIIQLLTGEVPVKCEDASVCISMEERECLEGHKKLSKDVRTENLLNALDKPALGDLHTPVSLYDFGTENKTNNAERYLNKAKKGAADSEPECLASGERRFKDNVNYSTIECTEYSPSDIKEESASCEENLIEDNTYRPTEYSPVVIKEEPDSCEEENLPDCDIYKTVGNTLTEYTSGDTGAESDSHRVGELPDHEMHPHPEHTQTEYPSTDIKKESPAYEKKILSDNDLYKPTDWSPDHLREHLTGNTNTLEINHGENFIESIKLDQSIYYTDPVIYNSVYKSNTAISSEMHETTCREIPFSLTACGESASKHQLVHAEAQPCPECGKHFTDSIGLKKHQRIHTGNTQFKCTECGKCFTQASHLAAHNRIHTGEKPFNCSECGTRFTQASHLARHKLIHTGERPFNCCECGKCFAQTSDLTRHKMIHSGEKPFKCTVCGKCFTQASYLTKHKRTHTGEKPFTCTECGKCFTETSSLAKHKRIHTGEKPFTCTECSKCFTRASSLAAHKIIHSGEKPFTCTECGKCFTWASSLATHKMNHTG
uniref:C2H2-type domain-containing protein n=1 Tax=Leptobrachium leishanense TaxID=445787 RepID=A0A8C5PLC6_9ANUR